LVSLSLTPYDSEVTNIGKYLHAKTTVAYYRWLNCRDFSEVSGETDVDFYPREDGSYALEITYGSCVDTTSCESFNVEHPVVYRNPSTDEVNVYLGGISNYQVRVFDRIGKLIHQEFNKTEVIYKFSVEELKSGLYIIEITNGEDTHHIKFLKL
jgi:hypothetical protein